MLNENAEKILQIILRECGNGYRVLSKEDFASIPDYADIIAELAGSGYLSLRFTDGEEYLICPSYKARNYYNEKREDYYFHAVICKKAAIYSFVGGLSGGIIAVIVCLIIGMITAK